ncbi:IclR family transcriptional regulator [Shinella sp. CPCC 100929]|uniref:IclR family transcriptional regulator n=1 Tax=Shinella lacus TaxID=2654216 RepID=A0ABT1REC2_9HYPH|nr:IclR family transcriptional regulator [Shinella lacus]MCQ4633531.1 IclR family transcriptional regulator [Shinella lacus]
MSLAMSALRRSHTLLLHVAQAGEHATLGSIASDLEMPQSTVHRVLSQLVEEGLVVVGPAGHYRLGWKALQLARRIWNAASEEELALPLMRELSETTGETVTLNKYIPSEGFCVCVAVAETSHSLSYALNVGDTRHLNMGAGGKSILAGMGDADADAVIARHGLPSATKETVTDLERLNSDIALIRSRGYAVSSGESVEGAIGYAVPIFYRGEMVFGSMAVTAPQIRFRAEWEKDWLAALVDKARTLSELLGASQRKITTFYPSYQKEAANI